MRNFSVLILLIVLMFSSSVMSIAQDVELTWSFLHPIKKEWVELGVKGSVQEGLIENKELPDPFYGLNEEKFNWIEDHQWEFKSMFFLDKELERDFVELIFPSIDTYAKVYLNDQLVLETDNAFIPHSVDIKKHAVNGLNELVLVFTPPVIYHKDKLKEVGYQLPAPNDVHDVAIAPYSRKPQYQFGWDWALRMNTIGLNKPARISSYDDTRLLNKTTRIISVEADVAIVEFDIQLSNSEIKEIWWESKLFGSEKVKGKNGVFTRQITVKSPKLWWPRGQGDAFLYEDYISVQNIEKQGLVSFELKFGVKTSELVQEHDEWGTSYYFKINGRRVFCKGADYIPQEIFPARVTDEMVVDMVDLMAESNFNMIRVWGGGYYPDEVFFERCDELGIMVWEDLMFACAMYPGDDEFIDNITKEFEYQIPRISAHPSVVLFNGNNEVEVAWGNWGFQVKHGLYGKSAKEIESAYDRIFKNIAPAVVEKHNTVPYIHTSPLSNWGKKELYNHGSQHYWGVWHGKDPIEDFGKKIGRFNAEYGFQSFPEYNTLSTFSSKADWDLSSPVMKHHQKSYVGNDMILKHAKRLYGNPESFEDFIYYSQLTQAMAVSMAVAGHRIDAPRCGGTLYWQLNDCWPAPTWSSVDYNGNWKALQYRMRDDYLDVSVVAKYNDLNDVDYYLVSDVVNAFKSNVKLKVFGLDGSLVSESDTIVELDGNGSHKIDVGEINTNAVLTIDFENEQGERITRTFDHLRAEYEKAKEEDVVLSIVSVDKESKSLVLNVSNTKYLRNLWISSSEFGLKFDSNFESLLPGEHKVVVQYEELPKLEDFKLMWL
jgi:beta-mannosidase